MVHTTTSSSEQLARVRLLQLVSPSLPIGSFTYSQGLEWAVEQRWVDDEASLAAWLDELLQGPLTRTDLPLLARLYGTPTRSSPGARAPNCAPRSARRGARCAPCSTSSNRTSIRPGATP
jgi:urease accessory protein UreF